MNKKTMLATLVMLSLLQGTAFGANDEIRDEAWNIISFDEERDKVDIDYDLNSSGGDTALLLGNGTTLTVNDTLDVTMNVNTPTTNYGAQGVSFNGSGAINVTNATTVTINDTAVDNAYSKAGVWLDHSGPGMPTFTMGSGKSVITVTTNDIGYGLAVLEGNVKGGELEINVDTTSGTGAATGIYSRYNSPNASSDPVASIDFSGKITMDIKAGDGIAYGVDAGLKDKFIFKAADGFDIKVNTKSEYNYAYGLCLDGNGNDNAENFEIGNGKLTVTGAGDVNAIYIDGDFADNSENKIGNIELDVNAGWLAYGVKTNADGKLVIDGLSGKVTSTNSDAYGVNVHENTTDKNMDGLKIGDSNLTVTAKNESAGIDVKGTFNDGSKVELGKLDLTVTSDKKSAKGLNISANGKYEVTLDSLKANVTGKTDTSGLYFANSDATMTVTNGLDLTVTGTGTKTASALDNNNGTLNVYGDVKLDATAAVNAAYGVSGSNTSQTVFYGDVVSDVEGAENSAAVYANSTEMHKSGITFNGGLKANLNSKNVYSIIANSADVIVNKSNKDVQLNGNIKAGEVGAYGNKGNVSVAFNTANSYFKGATEFGKESGDGNSINLNFDNGSKWLVTDRSHVTDLNLSNGAVVDMTADEGAYSILTVREDLTGSGTFKMDIDASTNTNNSDVLHITNHSGTHYIDLNIKDGDTSGAVGTVLASVENEIGSFVANDKENALFWESYELTKETENVTDGYTADWILSAVTKDEEKGTTSVDTILGANALNYHTWRAENDQLMRRMGELRNNGADEEGAWFRVHGSKINRDDSMSFENKYTTYELGYDQITKQKDDMTRYTGAALSYTDGSSGYESGNGENHSKAIAFYNTDIYNSGHYLDLLFKYANMDNDFNVYDTNNNKISGEYKNTGISVSAEYGRKNELKHGWYVEPQAQLTLGYFGGDEYETSNGISVDQSGIASVLGRVGFNIGKQIGDSGVIYAKANLLHEFAGDYDIDMYDSAGNHRAESASFNDTWFEYGIGAALKTGKNNHLYFDLAKTAGGDFEKEWTWNAGMRWTF